MIMVVVPVKEEDIPETSANDADKGDGDAEVKDMLMPAASVLLQKVVGHNAAEDDAQGKKDSIKADRKSTDESDILMHGGYSFVYGNRESDMRKQEAFPYRAFFYENRSRLPMTSIEGGSKETLPRTHHFYYTTNVKYAKIEYLSI